MIRVLNIIHSLTVGGAARTMIATAKYSAKSGPYHHALAILDLKHTDPGAVEFAMSEGMEIPIVRNRSELLAEIERADIVQVNWWQHPEMDAFLRSDLPPLRLIGWLHVAGDNPPQLVTGGLVDRCDLALGGSSYTYHCDAFQRLPTAERLERTGYVTGGADLSRLAGVGLRQHTGFNVGYIGTVNPVKMHPDFVMLHDKIDIPDLKVIVCGGDRHLGLKNQAEQCGIGERFDFRGYVSDIGSVLAELDVYGYPLCRDTYAASELNLQEAMSLGLPAVVFPYGGLKTLVIDDFSGIVVQTAEEYRQAITHLYRDPAERLRLGNNARHFAAQMFGAERNAPKMNGYYERLMKSGKRKRQWSSPLRLPDPFTGEAGSGQSDIGSRLFIESLGDARPEFQTSLDSDLIGAVFHAEGMIARSTELMCRAGILPYAGTYHIEGTLQLWSGLALIGVGDYGDAAKYLFRSFEIGLPRFGWRVFWYIALCGLGGSDKDLARMALRKCIELAPEFTPAAALLNILDSNAALPVDISVLVDPLSRSVW